jgi:PAS domain-containing protein
MQSAEGGGVNDAGRTEQQPALVWLHRSGGSRLRAMAPHPGAPSDATLEDQRRLYETLFEASLTAIAVVDAAWIVTAWTPAAERLFGYAEAEAVGRHIDDLWRSTRQRGPTPRPSASGCSSNPSNVSRDARGRTGRWSTS